MRPDLPAMDGWLAERCGMYTEWLDESRIAVSSLGLKVNLMHPSDCVQS